MLRKHKRFQRPRKLYDKSRIEEENRLVTKYGLKNKREIWKTEAKIKYFRSRAKALITSNPEIQELYLNKLNKIGLNVRSISDVLALDKENLLKRRLSSVIFQRGISKTAREGRQMIVHKRILVNDKVVNSPSYLVKINEENSIKIKHKSNKTNVETSQKLMGAEDGKE